MQPKALNLSTMSWTSSCKLCQPKTLCTKHYRCRRVMTVYFMFYPSQIMIAPSTKHCSSCRERTLFSNGFLLILSFQSFSKFFPSPLHEIFLWNIKNMTEELHSIKSRIKWKHEPNYDGELSKCNFLQSQTSTPVKRFCKSGWHKLHQQPPSMELTLSRWESLFTK